MISLIIVGLLFFGFVYLIIHSSIKNNKIDKIIKTRDLEYRTKIEDNWSLFKASSQTRVISKNEGQGDRFYAQFNVAGEWYYFLDLQGYMGPGPTSFYNMSECDQYIINKKAKIVADVKVVKVDTKTPEQEDLYSLRDYEK